LTYSNCVLIFEDKTGRIHLCDGAQLWNLGTVTTDMIGGTARDAQAWLRGDWTPDQAAGHIREGLAEIVAPVQDATHLIAVFRGGRLYINTDPDGRVHASAAGRRYLGVEGVEGDDPAVHM
jgi:hypothetical protein